MSTSEDKAEYSFVEGENIENAQKKEKRDVWEPFAKLNDRLWQLLSISIYRFLIAAAINLLIRRLIAAAMAHSHENLASVFDARHKHGSSHVRQSYLIFEKISCRKNRDCILEAVYVAVVIMGHLFFWQILLEESHSAHFHCADNIK